ncbi:MAG: hypothetical protein ACK5NK_00910 [Niabella sp.]
MHYSPLNKSGYSFTSLLFCVLLIAGLFACAPKAYKNLRQLDGSADCMQQFKPNFKRALYRTTVDVAGNHLSGILLIKQMPDSTTRLLFTNEAGFKFFDFGFSKTGAFTVHAIIKKMDKKAVKKTLQKDFQLLLMNFPQAYIKPYTFKGQQANEKYYAYQNGNDFYYYITNINCKQLIRMERGSHTKKVVVANSSQLHNGLPDTLKIHHLNFNFDINLTIINENAE